MDLYEKGFRPKQNLVSQWLRRPQRFRNLETEELFKKFLDEDLKETSMPAIPEDFDTNSTYFPSTVLQIVDTTDIGNAAHSLLSNLAADTPVRQVYKKRGDVQLPRHTLRWRLSDGYKEVTALEYETIPELDILTPLGCKLYIKGCQAHHGIIFLTPSNVTVYGGQVSSFFDGDMIATLERRLKERLKMPARMPSTKHKLVWTPPASSDPSKDIKKSDSFDNEISAITQDLNALTSELSQAQSRTESTCDSSEQH